MTCYDILDSPLGELIAASDDNGIILLEFYSKERVSRKLATLALLNGSSPLRKRNIHLGNLEIELGEYFAGNRKSFTVPVVMTGTVFQKQVWNELLNIPFGETRSYMAQASAIGKPGAIRAVARANGTNPVSVIIPCHRVIGSDGKLTGYGGGLWRKRWLLEHERKYSSQVSSGMLF